MDRMLYIAMTGAKQTLQAQAVNSHNLANINTTGFRQDLAAFQSLPMQGPGHADARVYAVANGQGADMRHGSIVHTGNELDVAINGEGWLVVQAPDGSEAYTRAGDLRIDSAGMLTTGAGHLVMGDGGPIAVPPAQKLEIGVDGTVSIQPLGEAATTLAVLDRIKLVKPDRAQLEKGADGLMHSLDGVPAAPDATVRITSGALESSNVNSVDALVNMIDLARNYELQVKMMKEVEDNDAAMNKVIQA